MDFDGITKYVLLDGFFFVELNFAYDDYQVRLCRTLLLVPASHSNCKGLLNETPNSLSVFRVNMCLNLCCSKLIPVMNHKKNSSQVSTLCCIPG